MYFIYKTIVNLPKGTPSLNLLQKHLLFKLSDLLWCPRLHLLFLLHTGNIHARTRFMKCSTRYQKWQESLNSLKRPVRLGAGGLWAARTPVLNFSRKGSYEVDVLFTKRYLFCPQKHLSGSAQWE